MPGFRAALWPRRLARLFLAPAVAGLACSSSGPNPPPPPPPSRVGTVAIAAPADVRLAVGRARQLSATATDKFDRVLTDVTITWSSSAPARAEVDGTGRVTGRGAGSVTITAKAEDKTASVELTVIDANLGGIDVAVNDGFLDRVVQNLTPSVKTGFLDAIALCRTGATDGDFKKLDDCLSQGQTLLNAASDPTDRALGASASLYLNYIVRAKSSPTQAPPGGNP